MSKLELIEKDIQALPHTEALALQDWLSAYLEDSLELNPEFVKGIEEAKAEIRAGKGRIIKPQS